MFAWTAMVAVAYPTLVTDDSGRAWALFTAEAPSLTVKPKEVVWMVGDMRSYRRFGCLVALVLLAWCPVGARADFVNPSFTTGDLTGWTPYTTSNGTGTPTVVTFNTTGSGASDSVQMSVGEKNQNKGDGGAGISQALTLATGNYTVSADLAATITGGSDPFGGVFSILMDGTVLATFDAGALTNGQIVRDQLSASFTLASAGSHTFSFQVTRASKVSNPNPDDYLTNLHIGATVVPEPSSVVLLGIGIAFALLVRGRSYRVVV